MNIGQRTCRNNEENNSSDLFIKDRILSSPRGVNHLELCQISPWFPEPIKYQAGRGIFTYLLTYINSFSGVAEHTFFLYPIPARYLVIFSLTHTQKRGGDRFPSFYLAGAFTNTSPFPLFLEAVISTSPTARHMTGRPQGPVYPSPCWRRHRRRARLGCPSPTFKLVGKYLPIH